MRVLIACEESQVVTKAFRKKRLIVVIYNPVLAGILNGTYNRTRDL